MEELSNAFKPTLVVRQTPANPSRNPINCVTTLRHSRCNLFSR
eukprot:gene33194-42926_t